MARRTRKKPQFQVELDRLMCEVEGEDCAATDTHKVTEGPEPVGLWAIADLMVRPSTESVG